MRRPPDLGTGGAAQGLQEGLKGGACSTCGRRLEDPASVALRSPAKGREGQFSLGSARVRVVLVFTTTGARWHSEVHFVPHMNRALSHRA